MMNASRHDDRHGCAEGATTVIRFGDFALDVQAEKLWRGGVRVPIQRKPLRLLICLARGQRGEMRADQLLSLVWPGVSVSQHALGSAVRDLRRALGDHDRTRPVIATRRGYGYRLMLEAFESPGPSVWPGVGPGLLSRSETAQALCHATGRPLSPQTVSAVLIATGGKPLFLQELLATLIIGDGHAAWNRADEVPLPDSVRLDVSRAFRALPEVHWPVVRSAMALGLVFSLDGLELVSRVGREQLNPTLAAGHSAGLFRRLHAPTGGYAFASGYTHRVIGMCLCGQ